MKIQMNTSATSSDSSQHAEKQIKATVAETARPRPAQDSAELSRELQAQKLELEMQNEQLLKAYDSLDKALVQYAELYDFAPVGYVTFDRNGIIRNVNYTCANLLGIERIELPQLIGRDFCRHVAPEDRPAFNAFLDKVYRSHSKEECEARLQNDKHVRIEAVTAKSGKECRAILFDITERKRAEEALRESEQRFKNLVETTSDWVWEVNGQGCYTYVSPKIKELLGYEPEEVIGKTPFDFMPGGEAERLKLFFKEKATRCESFQAVENINIRKDGSQVILETSGVPIFDGTGAFCGYRGIDRDITEREAIKEELAKTQKLESLGVLAGGIAHDFNNLLTGILGNICFARRCLDDPEKVDQLLNNAETASTRAATLAKRLLTFARGGRPAKKPVLVEPLIRKSVSSALQGTNVHGVIAIPAELRAIAADAEQLRLVFDNIINNAVQAMPNGGTLTVTAENVTLKGNKQGKLPSGEYVKLAFTDEGYGIPHKNLGKIFDPYFTSKSGGKGLGLATVYSIVTKHGGQIDVHSGAGKGTTFTIYLPATEPTSTEQPAKKVLPAPGKAGGVVLVMDDERLICDIVGKELKYLGYEVTTCATGEEAIALYKAANEAGKPFIAAILDLTIVGGMGGKETAQRILALDPAARLIVSSGYSDDPVMAAYEQYGFCAALAKPYKITDLDQAILSSRRAAIL
jgi:PAS domain S-box-containing protein